MSYNSKYTGNQVDKALEKMMPFINDAEILISGWQKIASSSEDPKNLDDIKSPGNYIVMYWKNGPDFTSDMIAPINISVISIDNTLHQFVTAGIETYVRIYQSNIGKYGEWTIDQSNHPIIVGTIEPSSPNNNKTIWLDTSDNTNPTIKLYRDNNWVSIISDNSFTTNVYDKNYKKQDIFEYISDTIEEKDTGNIGDISSHINDINIHVTTDERNKLNKIDALEASVESLNDSIQDHADDTEIHPSQEKQSQWSNKADQIHTHDYIDGNVYVDTDHIIGSITSNMLPADIKERVYKVSNESVMYSLTKKDIHNGDALYIENSDNTSTWYFVIDDSYLETKNASLAFKKFTNPAQISWDKIEDTPSTLAEYGITDAATKEDKELLNREINRVSTKVDNMNIDNVTETNEYYQECLSRLEIVDTTIGTLDSAVTILENIVK